MTQEEKAKAYDEAKARMNRAFNDNRCSIGFMNEIFPEIKESADTDEKVRKALIKFVTNHASMDLFIEYDIHLYEALAWFEKRKLVEWSEEDLICLGYLADFVDNTGDDYYGKNKPNVVKWIRSFAELPTHTPIKEIEQKSADKVEPKFHEGEWVVTDKNNVVQIKAVEDSKYVLENTMRFSVDYVDKCWRKWIIQDAKAGDVLTESKRDVILMFREIGNTEWVDVIDYYCYYDCHRKDFVIQEGVEHWGNTEDSKLKPATKEQRDTLIKAIADAGYTFDFEKKELKKIEKKPDDMFRQSPIARKTGTND